MKHQYYWALAIGAVAGFYLANAQSRTGIYASFIGNTAANVYTAGFNAFSATPSASGTSLKS